MTRILAATLALVALFAPFPSFSADGPQPPYRVFLVNSYNPEYFWSAEQQRGIRDALDGLDIELREFFMDSKRNPGNEWLQARFTEVLAEIEAFRPDIIFTGDDNATKTVARHYLGKKVPVVFYGVNDEPEAYGLVQRGRRPAPGQNVTGVLERHFFVDASNLLQTVCKANDTPIRNLYLLSDDSYTSGRLFELLREMDWPPSLEVHFLPPISTFAQYRDTLRSINHPGNAVVIYNLQTIQGEDGSALDYRPILGWTRQEIRIPSVSFHEVYIQEGMMLGILVSGYSQAYNAGLKGRAILEGTAAGAVPIDSPTKGRVVVNSTMLKRLGLKLPLSVLLGATVHTYPDG